MTKHQQTDNNHIIIGQCGRAYGVKGWIHIQSYTSPPENILKYQKWMLQTTNGTKQVTVESARAHGDHFVAKLAGINNPEDTSILRLANILIERNTLPELEEGEHYWIDLIGLQAKLTNGHTLGKITEILETGANDVLIIVDNNGNKHLVPYIDSVVEDVDYEQSIIMLNWEPIENYKS